METWEETAQDPFGQTNRLGACRPDGALPGNKMPIHLENLATKCKLLQQDKPMASPFSEVIRG
jgi:hypothetical protein